MISAWSFPTRVLFGAGAVERVGPEAVRLGAKRAFIVSDEGVVAAGMVETVATRLGAVGIAHSVYSGISSNPLESEVLSAAESYRSAGCDLIIGLGGGSPLDVAKLVRVAVTHPLPLAT